MECFGEGDLGDMSGLAGFVGTDEGVPRIHDFRRNARISCSFPAVNSVTLFDRERALLVSLLETDEAKLPVLERRLIFAFL